MTTDKPLSPIIFLRIAWMENYQGVTLDDIPKGAGSYVTDNADGGEVFNFSKNRGNYYGYARIQSGRSINLSKLGASKNATEIKGVTVVFFAKNPTYGSQYIVGWYKNATLLSNIFESQINNRGDWGNYLTHCKVSDGTLIPIEQRTFEVEGPGQTNLWYPELHYSKKELDTLCRYIDNPSANTKKLAPNKFSRGWQIDAELRKKIEIAAMEAVAYYFENRGFTIDDVHKQNKGWDLEAIKKNKIFQLEIKGTQGDFNTVELTPNEFKQLNSLQKTFRLCIVSNALDTKKQQTDIFYFDGKNWINERKQILSFEKVISARVSLL